MDMQSLPYRQGVSIILFDKVKNLILISRGKSWKEGDFAFPSGGIEFNESVERAAIREMREELNIDIIPEISSKEQNTFLWPEDVVMRNGYKYKGQSRSFVLAYFDSTNAVNFNENELAEIKWIVPEDYIKFFNFPNLIEFTGKVLKEFNIL